MRLQQQVPLGGTRFVNVQELHVRTGRNLLSQAKKLDQIDVQSLLVDQFDELVGLLGDCVEMPKGETLDDLTFSEVALVKDALLEVNAAFLELMGMALEKVQSPQS